MTKKFQFGLNLEEFEPDHIFIPICPKCGNGSEMVSKSIRHKSIGEGLDTSFWFECALHSLQEPVFGGNYPADLVNE